MLRASLARLPSRDRATIPFAVLGIAAGVLAGAVMAHSPTLGVAVVALLAGLALAVSRPILVAVIAVAAVFVVQRFGGSSSAPGSSGGITYSDGLMLVASLLAVPALLGSPELQRLRVVGYGFAAYVACLLPTVLLNSSTRGYLEFGHRLILVGGSLLVGAWITRENMIRPTLRLLTACAVVVAVAAIVETFRHHFLPGTPFSMNKNFVGAQLAAVLIVLIMAGAHLHITPRLQAVAAIVLVGGLAASQSRGAMLGAASALLLTYILSPRSHSRRARASTLAVALALGIAVFISVRGQLNQTRQEILNGSLGVRYNVERVTRHVWRTSPIHGVGLRYFIGGHYGRFAVAANNVVDNELAESGVIGLFGFVVLQLAALTAGVRRRGERLAAAGTGVVFGLLVHGMVDIYWTAGTVALGFALLGMALARPPAKPETKPAHRAVTREKSRLLPS